jgi:hypothetical protein
MNANEIWAEFNEFLKKGNTDGMKSSGQRLRDLIDSESDWPTGESRSTVYHHLKLQLEICGGGTWHPKYS